MCVCVCVCVRVRVCVRALCYNNNKGVPDRVDSNTKGSQWVASGLIRFESACYSCVLTSVGALEHFTIVRVEGFSGC